MIRVGISGGTFDPIHIGHVKSAEYVYKTLELDEVVFIPNGQPPHKVTSFVTDERHRFEMVKLAIKDYPAFSVSDIEMKKDGYSYTVDTLRALTKEYRQKFGDVKLYYIIGTDVLGEITSWKESNEVFKLCEFVVLRRPGFVLDNAREKAEAGGAKIHVVDAPQIDISSTRIRELLEEGKDVKMYIPEKVYTYILSNNLYRERKAMGFEEIKKDLEGRLSEKRYIHTLGVVDECERLGKIYGVDQENCKLAGLLHDCAKDMDIEQYKWLGVSTDATEEELVNGFNVDVLHARAGRIIAAQRYGITDTEVLDAIENHVTGRPGMTLLEQIVFLADYTEVNRRGVVYDKIRNELDKGLVNGIIAACDNTIKYLLDKNVLIRIETIQTRNYYLTELKKKSEREVT
ncbi:MAG TPA: nicotinate-nucleotide adenylyltransferase [Clostridia bacterium]|jgi:nicotinate-nucleotide adenylyltransferase|nr:nicotinate-nucleotide adenylyltransferase [Clostridia bacterium]